MICADGDKRYWFHVWGEWSDGTMTFSYPDIDIGGKPAETTKNIQVRWCERCHKQKFRRVRI